MKKALKMVVLYSTAKPTLLTTWCAQVDAKGSTRHHSESTGDRKGCYLASFVNITYNTSLGCNHEHTADI